MLAVLTDANGAYSFINVPDGNYQIVEYYGMTPAVPTPGDFSTATTGSILTGGVVPSLSYAPVSFVPPGATDLDCVTPNTLLRIVTGADLTDQNILNGPVRYTPINAIIDSHAVVSTDNLIVDADDGTFGVWPPGASADTLASVYLYYTISERFSLYLKPALSTAPSWPEVAGLGQGPNKRFVGMYIHMKTLAVLWN